MLERTGEQLTDAVLARMEGATDERMKNGHAESGSTFTRIRTRN